MENTQRPDLEIDVPSGLPTILPPLEPLLNRARSLVIATAEDADDAATILTEDVLPPQRMIKDWFAEPKARAHALHKDLCAREAAALARYAEPERILRAKIAAYHSEQERLRREAEAAAAKERERLEEEERLRLAVEAEAAGDEDAVEALLDNDAPPVMVPMPATPAPTRVQGVSFAKRHKAEVTDLRALAKAVADGTAPVDCITANQTKLDQMARALGASLRVPGVRVVEVADVRVAGRLRR